MTIPRNLSILAESAGAANTPVLNLPNAGEVTTVSNTAAAATLNYDIGTQSVLYYTANTGTTNWAINFRWSSTVSANSAIATNQTVTVAFLATQGATAYVNNAVQVDGTTTGVTTKWQGGTAPTTGNASSVDVYTYTIVKTASTPTYTVFASQTKFA